MAELEGADSTPPDLSALRAQYQAVVGKRPSPIWGADKLQEKIDAAPDRPPAPPPEAPPASGPADPVKVILLCDHVFLPADPTAPGWETSDTTQRYDGKTDDKRTRLDMHPALAAFLQSRGQAEILD